LPGNINGIVSGYLIGMVYDSITSECTGCFPTAPGHNNLLWDSQAGQVSSGTASKIMDQLSRHSSYTTCIGPTFSHVANFTAITMKYKNTVQPPQFGLFFYNFQEAAVNGKSCPDFFVAEPGSALIHGGLSLRKT